MKFIMNNLYNSSCDSYPNQRANIFETNAEVFSKLSTFTTDRYQ